MAGRAVATIFSALADGTRLDIVARLAAGDATLTELAEHTTLVRGDAIEAARAMKADAPGPLRAIGGVSLCRSLLQAGTFDRSRVVMFPVIIGASGAEHIYDGYPHVALDMVKSRTFDKRIQLVGYQPRVLGRPPLPPHPARYRSCEPCAHPSP